MRRTLQEAEPQWQAAHQDSDLLRHEIQLDE